MNLLSVGAGLGVLVAIFQWGILDSLLHYRSPGSLDSLTPPIVIAFVFGLSMDYEIFLVSRIRERWQVSGDPQRAVREALVASAGAISSAALILVCALGVFVAVGGSSVKEIGVGIAVAIAVDATLIRLALVPATMEILGEWNWWWPSQIEAALRAPRKWMAARRGIKTPA
jgi:RND superfamily putative drug exporter